MTLGGHLSIFFKDNATFACFLRAILYSVGYWVFNGWLPKQVSSQNIIWLPSFNLKIPKLKKDSLTPLRLVQKCESPAFLLTCVRVLSLTYLFINNCCQTPSSSLQSLKSHLLKSHLFCKSRYWIPRAPCSLGWYPNGHLTSLYFFLCWLFCQKKSRPVILYFLPRRP